MKQSLLVLTTLVFLFAFQSNSYAQIPVADFSANNTTICAGSCISFTDLSTNAPAIWLWSFPGGTPATSNVQNPTICYNTAGTYSITLIAINGFGSDTVIKTGYITVNPNPVVVTITPNPATICAGSCDTLTASGASNYYWVTSIGLNCTNCAVVIACPQTTTSYTVTGIDMNGCTADSWVTVYVSQNVTVNPQNPSICSGNAVTLTASGGSSYTWTPAIGLSGTSGSVVTASPSTTTTYNVTGTDVNSCTSTSSVTVTVNPNPTVTAFAVSDTICLGECVTLTASGANNYFWSNFYSGSPMTVCPPTTTPYTVTGTDVNGCSNTDSVTVYVDSCLYIDQFESAEINIDLFPNPAHDKLTIVIATQSIAKGKQSLIEIYNIQGQLVKQIPIPQSPIEIDVSTLTKGIYIVKLQTENGVVNKKLIIQ